MADSFEVPILTPTVPVVGGNKNVRFKVGKDPSGGARLFWNEDQVVLAPADAYRVMCAIGECIGIVLEPKRVP